MAVGWQDNVYKSYLTAHGTTLPGKRADKRRQDKESNVNFALQVPRPACIAKYNEEMGAVDRHNFYRQGVLRLHMAWTTKTWQTRIQMEILALALVDSFLACKNYCLNGFFLEICLFFGGTIRYTTKT